ncbi:hypothetical protein ED92_39165 [Amycolatopsis sp. MJM2582]|nr:hypothetical protein ED92_39165 [Amycolatopsis sp. MJM2582]
MVTIVRAMSSCSADGAGVGSLTIRPMPVSGGSQICPGPPPTAISTRPSVAIGARTWIMIAVAIVAMRLLREVSMTVTGSGV